MNELRGADIPTAEFIPSLAAVKASDWNRLTGLDYPFLRHEFLLGLEQSHCTTAATGWQPCHLLLHQGDSLVAVLPLYLKSHSYGEYVFDWSWAEAWQRCGLSYYPKLVSAIPFTPATGPRLAVADGLDPVAAWDYALAAIRQFAQQRDLSSWHLLFPEAGVSELLLQRGLPRRLGTQFHWFNEGYRSFDDFLAGFASRKRKNLRRERDRVRQQGLSLRTLRGAQISPEHWHQFHHFYQLTYAKRSGHGGYLTREFFTETAPTLGEQVIMVLAEQGARAVAAALYFRSGDTLYGRYWGCIEEFDCLHFEACYYQGIEYCIAEGLQRFDPGAQGEHKIQRGFRPVATCSSHWIADPQLAAAVSDFTRREQPHNEAYLNEATTLLPFRRGP
ncbi:GNAT family N-acetyltransferase [Kineobactrum salinum]|uniref:N-acetyltransferase n=1 Tax=Kineobactrum salinum TaxID=2708301 RepID=A0A6C0U7V9_9GAMM|nr:GNAT family N-acetyltransferase [Kineobactrum salinum]QIB65574.1 N-acetyltransferase [Kineobactrum salinum]